MAVSSSRKSPSAPSSSFPWHLVLLLVVFAMVLFFGFFGVSVLSSHGQAVESATSSLADPALVVSKPQLRTADTVVSSINSTKDVAVSAPSSCETVELEVSSTTGIGKVTMKMHHDWAPLGAARFCELVEKKFYDDVRFFRVLKNFMAQTGMNGDPEQGKIWRKQSILDDPVLHSNSRGSVSFAMSGKNTRTTQIFFNTVNNKFLDGQGFAPFATIEAGMEVIDALYNKYGEGGRGDGSDGRGPSQGRINQEGNAYLNKVFPELSYIVSARIVS